jgi:hypothetical protein
MTVPATAKPKVIRTRAWESRLDPITVYLDPKPGIGSHRRFDVYEEDGTMLGIIGEYEGTIDTKLPGSRLVRRGKRRTFWVARQNAQARGDYWRNHVSQSDAIRVLVRL